jgi:hypothetical protein
MYGHADFTVQPAIDDPNGILSGWDSWLWTHDNVHSASSRKEILQKEKNKPAG